MLNKKFGALLTALSLAAACIPATFVSAEDAAWFDIEAESNLEFVHDYISDTAASGGKYLIGNDNHKYNSSTNTFSLEAAGTYDIWAVIGVDSSNYIGGYTFTLDGTDTFYSKSTELANNDAVGDSLYRTVALTGGSHNKDMKWVRIASHKTIASGEHTIKAATTKATATTNTFGAIDVMRFVPSDWNWVPSNNFNAPTDMTPIVKTNKDLTLEAENAVFSGYGIVTNSAASGGKALEKGATLEGYGTGALVENDYQISMTFKTEAATDDYEIWALTSGTGGHTSTFNYTLDDAKVGNIALSGTGVYSQSDAGFPGYNHSMQWGKVGVVSMAAGKHELVLTTNTSTDFKGRVLAALDCIRIVPIGLSFDNSKIDSETTIPEWFQIEAEDGADSEAEVVKGAFSWASKNGVIRGAYNGKTEQKGSSTIGVRNAGKYDIYAVIAFKDTRTTPYGSTDTVGYEFKANGNSFYKKYQTQIVPANDEKFTTGLGLGGGVAFDVQWVKIGEEIELSGKTVIDYAITAGANGGVGRGVIDCIRIVPSSWNWVPTGANFDEPTSSPISFTSSMGYLKGKTAYVMLQKAKAVGTADVPVVLILAIYNADDSLYGVYSVEKTLTTTEQNVSVSVTDLPSDFDATGKYVKGFVWSDLAAGIAYVSEPIYAAAQ